MINEKQFIQLAKEERIKIKAKMLPVQDWGFVKVKCSSDKEENVWCNVEPKQTFKDNYFKLYLIAEDKRYGKDEYYLCDLISLINSGTIECKII